MMRRFTRIVVAALLFAFGATCARAANADSADPDGTPVNTLQADRLLGVLPNYLTVESGRVGAQTTHDAFKAASLGTFDPVVYPMVGVMTLFGSGRGDSYSVRYGRAFADNAVGNFMTSAVVPSLTGEDSRYYRRGTGGLFSRIAYAASRSAITRTRAGAPTFNISEIGGNAAASALSNLYYSPADRTMNQTLTRWGTQVAWDTLTNELKEFWPDVREKLHRH